MTTLHVPADGWTWADLPGDVDFRYELVDGALLVSPTPSLRHQHASMQLALRLAPLLDDERRCVGPAGVYFDDRNYREPDVVVFRRRALDHDRLEVEEVLLAVEVMSPSSIKNDRVAKPAQYAAAGIPSFWRLELDPLLLVVHSLNGDAYREAGRFTDEVVVDEPVPLRFRLADLLA